MAINMVCRLTGGALNSTPSLSLGGVLSSTALNLENAIHNLFPKVEEAERAAGSIKYAAFGIANIGDTPTTTQRIYILSDTASADSTMKIGIDTIAGAHNLTDNLELIANNITPPSNIIFSTPSLEAPIELPVIGANKAIRVWVELTLSPGSVSFPDDRGVIIFGYL